MRTPLITFALVFLSTAVVWGQSASATLSARILDSSGVVIVGAEVQLRNVATSQLRHAGTGEDGQFVFPGLEPGQYELIATHTGFHRHVETDLGLKVGQAARMDIKLARRTTPPACF